VFLAYKFYNDLAFYDVIGHISTTLNQIIFFENNDDPCKGMKKRTEFRLWVTLGYVLELNEVIAPMATLQLTLPTDTSKVISSNA
jgi:hypothetical protein